MSNKIRLLIMKLSKPLLWQIVNGWKYIMKKRKIFSRRYGQNLLLNTQMILTCIVFLMVFICTMQLLEEINISYVNIGVILLSTIITYYILSMSLRNYNDNKEMLNELFEKQVIDELANQNIKKYIQKEYMPTTILYYFMFIIFIIIPVLREMGILTEYLNLSGVYIIKILPLIIAGIEIIIAFAKTHGTKDITRNIEYGINEMTIHLKEEINIYGKEEQNITVDMRHNSIYAGYFGEIEIIKLGINKEGLGEPIYIRGENIDYVQIGKKTFAYSFDEVEWVEYNEIKEKEFNSSQT